MRRREPLSPEFDHSSDREGYRWQAPRIGRAIGGKQMGASLYELADGERSLSVPLPPRDRGVARRRRRGTVLRDKGGERTLKAGDVVCFPVGPDGAHQVLGPGRVLIISASASLEVSEYPDSGKVGVSHPRKVFRLDDSVDYWEGE